MAALQAAIDKLMEANVAALDRGRMACARKRLAVSEFDLLFSRLAAYVNSVAVGNIEKLGSSGFPFAKRPAPVNDLQQPVGVHFRPTNWDNKVEMRWKRVPGALVYQVERALAMDASNAQWERVGLTSRPKLMVDRTLEGRTNTYRVCAIGTQLQGPYSNALQPKAA